MSLVIETNELLRSWGLDEFCEVFEAEGITVDIFKDLLDDGNLDKLIKPLGKRIFLKKKISEYILNQTAIERELEKCPLSEPLTEVTSVVNSEQNTSISINFDDVPICFSPMPISVSEKVEEYDRINCKQAKYSSHVHVSELNLSDLLKKTTMGKALMNWYTLKGGFDSTRQGYLVDILVGHFLDLDIHLLNSDFLALSNKITELFPCEIQEAYYLPPIKKRDSRDSKPGIAKGKLVDKYRNKLTFLREAGLIKGRGKENEQPEKNTDQNDSNTVVKESLIWFKHNSEPWEEVVINWDNTFTYRRLLILNEKKSIEDIYAEFPILTNASSVQLINKDFQKIYPKAGSLFQNFKRVVEYLINIRKKLVSAETDKILIDLLDSEKISEDYLHYSMFILLPSLLPGKAKLVTPDKKQYKPKLIDTREGIALRAELPADIEHLINQKREKLWKLNLPLHPFIVVEGRGCQINNSYVFANNELYPVESVLKAVDICFKWYHVFNIKYQFESEHIWYFIQLGIYNLKTRWDRPSPNILDIINKIKV